MRNKVLSLPERFKIWKLTALASIPEAVLFCNSIIACASGTTAGNVTQKVEKASTSIWTILKTICISLLAVVLAICGLMLVIGTQKMKDSVKEHFYSIAIGCMILFLAKDIAKYMEDTFG